MDMMKIVSQLEQDMQRSLDTQIDGLDAFARGSNDFADLCAARAYICFALARHYALQELTEPTAEELGQ
jgi:hypothetical protein